MYRHYTIGQATVGHRPDYQPIIYFTFQHYRTHVFTGRSYISFATARRYWSFFASVRPGHTCLSLVAELCRGRDTHTNYSSASK